MKPVISLFDNSTIDTKDFWNNCDRGELRINHCEACRRYSHFPRRHCPHCGNRTVTPRAVSGNGVVYTFAQVRFSPFGTHWKSDLPYCVAHIDLEEGVRFLSRIVGEDREQVRIGSRVSLVFVDVLGEEKRRLPCFKLLA